VTLSIIKFLGFEQIFKNALTGLPIGGAKGGADFDPKGRSDAEMMRFCQSFMTELYRYLGEYTDVPAGDIGVGTREINFMFGQYKRITNRYESGVITGKSLNIGGAPVRTESTGYGLVYFLERMLQAKKEALEGKVCIVSGAGNVAIHALEKLHQLGAKVIACSDSGGYLYDESGIDLEALKYVKLAQRARLQAYLRHRPEASFVAGGNIWNIPCQIALPCATENELNGKDAEILVQNGCIAVAEGANMPRRPRGRRSFLEAGVSFGPGKAAERGRGSHFCPGDAAKCLEGFLELRVHRNQAPGDHDRHPRPLLRDGRRVRQEGQLRGRCEHRGVYQGGPGNGRAGAGIGVLRACSLFKEKTHEKPRSR